MSTKILELKDVTSTSRGFCLKNINLTIEPGYIYGLMGANGAGKTTLMKTIMSENAKYRGNIFIQGENIKNNHAKMMNQIGFVSEDVAFFGECSAIENARILGSLYDEFDMNLFKDVMKKMNQSCGKVYGKMSRGEKLKFQLAFAIAHKPCLYLLDEVTAGMDPVFRIDFFSILQELLIDENASILMTSHITSEMETKADYIGIMKEGKLIQFGESLDIIPKLKEITK